MHEFKYLWKHYRIMKTQWLDVFVLRTQSFILLQYYIILSLWSSILDIISLGSVTIVRLAPRWILKYRINVIYEQTRVYHGSPFHGPIPVGNYELKLIFRQIVFDK